MMEADSSVAPCETARLAFQPGLLGCRRRTLDQRRPTRQWLLAEIFLHASNIQFRKKERDQNRRTFPSHLEEVPFVALELLGGANRPSCLVLPTRGVDLGFEDLHRKWFSDETIGTRGFGSDDMIHGRIGRDHNEAGFCKAGL